MIKKTYSDVLCQAEAIVKNPLNRNRRGDLNQTSKRRISRLVVRITYLSQFESNNN